MELNYLAWISNEDLIKKSRGNCPGASTGSFVFVFSMVLGVGPGQAGLAVPAGLGNVTLARQALLCRPGPGM